MHYMFILSLVHSRQKITGDNVYENFDYGFFFTYLDNGFISGNENCSE